MPRIRPLTFWLARKKLSSQGAQLLSVCRDVPSAANELRWIREHIVATPSKIPPNIRLQQLCCKRARGVPLQYILGTQPFGDLEILCRPGVLIPRPETESYTLKLATLIERNTPKHNPPLRILDVCTGTGCIALQLHASLTPHIPTHIQAIDISPLAISVAERNLSHNIKLKNLPQTPTPQNTITFHPLSLFSPFLPPLLQLEANPPDIIISNPPYISRASFNTTTSRSVRIHEPRLALVPEHQDISFQLNCQPEDVFYARVLLLAKELKGYPKMILFEVADLEQAERVIRLVRRDGMLRGWYDVVEIWRDWPDGKREDRVVRGGEGEIPVVVRGIGEGRVVYLCNSRSRGSEGKE
ncbi:S-adenosyl-L-methionine-dependent methyltransferase [Podospora aff. communis PSN243]|uniref:S-adenosyl-L-methionine-dependent methyltransferase n=1 Tax=Podospora aff. communis PSN243 TaxID=3040156 RepID=A0AAV9H0L7_9PEZI|nr:S-adenosyl-L-methionine-dependent methyltransferase [Podospora aff. communis PSN243]